jgi:hypothetical protein
MTRLFSGSEDSPKPDEKTWVTTGRAEMDESGAQKFTRLCLTESHAFRQEPKTQYTIEYVKHTAILAALDVADQECYAGRLSWHRSMRLDFVLRHLNHGGYFVSKADVLWTGDKRL